MARSAFTCTLGQSLGNGEWNTSARGAPAGSIVTLVGTVAGTLTTDVAAAVAVLDADGADPTEAHVNDLVAAWDLLAAAIAAANTAAGGSGANVVLDIDNAVLTNQNAVRAALRKLMHTVAGSGLATGVLALALLLPNSVLAQQTATQPALTPVDRTIASASGSSQQIMAANAFRHSMTIVNTGNANCGVNPTGGTAAIGGAGTITLNPLGAYTPRIPTRSAVTVICTAGQPIYADEN